MMRVTLLLLTSLTLAGAAGGAPADKIPANIMTTLTAKFPQARIDKWTREKEDGKELYDIEFKQEGRKFEADIFADGTIHNWERQIAPGELPQAVVEAVHNRFPNAVLKEVMAVTAVTGGVERPEGYEIVVQRAHRKDIEMMMASDGRVLEGPGQEK
jgi:hypothetical protein